MALGTLADKQQIASLDCTRDIGNRDLMAAFPAPDIREQ
jgi:hypothetical protein